MGALPGEGGVVSSSCARAHLGEGGVVSSSCARAHLGEGGVVSSSCAQEEWRSTNVAKEMGSIIEGNIARGSLEHCYGGVGKHCCIQEHYYEQSKAMQGTTL